ncbi:hypothetical protein G4S63_004460 [Salmonella enterica]|nr:hypothetical protein [Salmonella enterica]
MSNNTSTARGWLTPTSGDPDYDEALDRLLSQWMRNVSGLPAGMVHGHDDRGKEHDDYRF